MECPQRAHLSNSPGVHLPGGTILPEETIDPQLRFYPEIQEKLMNNQLSLQLPSAGFGWNNKLYIQTGKIKAVSKQLHNNPKVEICAFADGKWIRVSGKLVEDDRREARRHMLDNYPSLRSMYNEDDGNTEVWYFKDSKAVIASFTEPPVEIVF